MLAAQALASLNIAQAHQSCRHSTKSEYTDESAQETSGPMKRSYENARMCSQYLTLYSVNMTYNLKKSIIQWSVFVYIHGVEVYLHSV